MRLEFSRFVEPDLEEIGNWIASGNPRRAATFISELRDAMEAIATNPLIYRLRPDIGLDARIKVHGNYLILFRIQGKVVRIERVVHGARLLRPLLRQ